MRHHHHQQHARRHIAGRASALGRGPHRLRRRAKVAPAPRPTRSGALGLKHHGRRRETVAPTSSSARGGACGLESRGQRRPAVPATPRPRERRGQLDVSAPFSSVVADKTRRAQNPPCRGARGAPLDPPYRGATPCRFAARGTTLRSGPARGMRSAAYPRGTKHTP